MKSTVSDLVGLCFVILCIGCGKAQPEPSPEISLKLFKRFECTLFDTKEPLPNEINLQTGTGVYVELTFEPMDSMPAEVDGKPIHRIGKWPMGIFVFPKGESRSSLQTSGSFFSPYSRAGSFVSENEPERDHPRISGTGISWFENGYKGAPKSDDTMNDSVRWTYLCQPKTSVKDFEYELLAWPCFDDSKASEIKLGSPIVLQRGTLKLTDRPAGK